MSHKLPHKVLHKVLHKVPHKMTQNRPQKQRGSMLVMALFVIVVLAMIGATMVQMIQASSRSAITDISGLQAKNAAQAGLEILGGQSFPLNAPIAACNTTITQPATFNNIPGFFNCRFTARCTTESVFKGPNEHFFYRFTSTGECDVGTIIVSRTLSVEALQER